MNYLPFMLLCLLINFSLFAKEIKCSEVKVTLLGHYGPSGKLISPLLKKWSLASGELSQVRIESRLKFSSIVLSLRSPDNPNSFGRVLKVKENLSESFKLSAFANQSKDSNKVFRIQLVDNSSKDFCFEESEILEVDGSDGVKGKN